MNTRLVSWLPDLRRRMSGVAMEGVTSPHVIPDK